MKIPTRTPSKRVANILAVPIIIIGSPVIAAIFFAVGMAKLQEWLMGPSWYWCPWFAWHFVDVDNRGTVWLEWVERRRWYNNTLYRVPGDQTVFGAMEGERAATPSGADALGDRL